MAPLTKRVPLANRLVRFDRGRLFATVAGTATAVILILLLLGIYRGVRIGSVSYIETQPVELWVARAGTGNLLRSTSWFAGSTLDAISFWPGVSEASPLLRILVAAQVADRRSTLFLFGIDPNAQAGLPNVTEGAADLGPGELIVDRAFARRRGLAIGDSVGVDRLTFRVIGISDGTNAVAAQYAFAHIDEVRSLRYTGWIVSFGLLHLEPDADPVALTAELTEAYPSLEFIEHNQFVANNVREMESGVLPVLWVIAILGLAGGLCLLALLLHGSVSAHREDYALLMAIGADARTIMGIVVRQALVLAAGGFVVGAIALPALIPLLQSAVPELAVELDSASMIVVAAAAIGMGLIGSIAPLLHLRTIYPGEVFRA